MFLDNCRRRHFDCCCLYSSEANKTGSDVMDRGASLSVLIYGTNFLYLIKKSWLYFSSGILSRARTTWLLRLLLLVRSILIEEGGPWSFVFFQLIRDITAIYFKPSEHNIMEDNILWLQHSYQAVYWCILNSLSWNTKWSAILNEVC